MSAISWNLNHWQQWAPTRAMGWNQVEESDKSAVVGESAPAPPENREFVVHPSRPVDPAQQVPSGRTTRTRAARHAPRLPEAVPELPRPST